MPQTIAAASDVAALADRYGEAWNAGDLEAIVALHAPDGVFHLHVPGAAPVQGHDAIREAFAGFLAQLEGIHFEPVRLRVGPDFWSLESILTGTAAAPFDVDGESLDAPGARIEVDFVDVIAVAGGLVARKDSYLDALAFQAQLQAGAAS